MKLILAYIIYACFILIACNTPKHTPTTVSKKATVNPSELNGSWQLTFLDDLSQSFEEMYGNRKPQITFKTGETRVSGNTGCNNFSGPVTIEGSKITFNQPLVMTKMMCRGDGEKYFLDALKRIDLWVLTDTVTLNFISGNIAIMKFSKVE